MKLQSLKVSGKKYDLRNIVVIIGPNNAGKTKLLEDLFYELSHSYDRTSESDYVHTSTQNTLWPQMTAKDYFKYDSSEVTEWLDAHANWKNMQENSGGRMNHMMLRSKNNVLQWQQGVDTAMYQDELEEIRKDPQLKNVWQQRFKKSHIHIARIDSRFTDATQIETIDTNSPDTPTSFYLQQSTLDKLNIHMKKLFDKKFVIVQLSPIQYRLLLVDKTITDNPKWAKSSSYEATQRSIAEHIAYADRNTDALISAQSHGTRAAAGILITLADKYRKILFIDEPESHIYPAARKYIGTLIADESAKRQFFIVTHDVDLLERLANSRKDFTVIKVGTNREIKVVDYNSRQRRADSAELKNTKAIRAGFNDATIFVEGVTDKYLYDAVIRQKKLIDDSIEYGLIDCDGNDRIADSVKFSKKIGTKVAIITDFDTILEKKKKKKGEFVIDRIIDSVEASAQLKKEASGIRTELANLVKCSKGLNAVGLNRAKITKINKLLEKFKVSGIFIVPCGALADWFNLSEGEHLAVEKLRDLYYEKTNDYKPLTDFITEVTSYINK